MMIRCIQTQCLQSACRLSPACLAANRVCNSCVGQSRNFRVRLLLCACASLSLGSTLPSTVVYHAICLHLPAHLRRHGTIPLAIADSGFLPSSPRCIAILSLMSVYFLFLWNERISFLRSPQRGGRIAHSEIRCEKKCKSRCI